LPNSGQRSGAQDFQLTCDLDHVMQVPSVQV
jgi:hypothetical protein